MNMLQRSNITFADGVFHLRTEHSSYLFRVTKFGHLEHVHYGAVVRTEDAAALALKLNSQYGSSVMYSATDNNYCLDVLPLEWSGEGRGDYRSPPIEARMPDGSYTTDFRYVSHSLSSGSVTMTGGLPTALSGDMTLSVLLRDEPTGAELTLIYTVFHSSDVISRRVVLKNTSDEPLTIHKLMSMSMDLAEGELIMTTLEGGWNAEAHRRDHRLSGGTLVNESRTGSSSNKANPGFFLREPSADERLGKVWGFNLVYSGNHHSSASLDMHGSTRVMCGISPGRFEWVLNKGDSFETPEAVMCFSDNGLGGMSRAMHRFVREHIVRGEWAKKDRPVLVNAWEAFMFSFDRDKLLGVARRAKRLGIELFVLDDGWFKGRDSDTAGLGDYEVCKKKLPDGLEGLSSRITKAGMMFGLWLEPEAVNPDSDLYRAHPDWAISDPGRAPVYGRNELLLDLTRAEVRDYIVQNVSKTLDNSEISYVKWDMNRHMSGLDGAFAHKYTLGLYEILARIFEPRPHILLETCSSGGNRFDLGMLCYSPQIWASDDTDPIERLDIQRGLSYFYPLSTMGAHVSAVPHSQTLRNPPLSTRFNVACFGLLGYEMDLRTLTASEENEVKKQISFYKEHRRTFQYGELYRYDLHDAQEAFTVVTPDGREAITGHFRRLVNSAPPFDFLPADGLDDKCMYTVKTKPQALRIGTFGHLISHAIPLKLNPDGAVMRNADKLFALNDCVEEYKASGAALRSGIRLTNLFNGTGYNEKIRLPGDFGSNLYIITRMANKNESLRKINPLRKGINSQ